MADENNKAIFKPILVESNQLNSIAKVPGQYIVVRDTGEVFVDNGSERVKVSNNVYIKTAKEMNDLINSIDTNKYPFPKSGDIWIEIE